MPVKRRYKFIVVSNRLPIAVSKKKGKLVYSPSSGGLATAMSSVSGEDAEKLWIGWPGISSEDITPYEKKQITKKLMEDNYFPIFLSREQTSGFYEGYSNSTIWPLFHYFQLLVKYSPEYWQSYKEVNKLFSKATLKFADVQTLIWVHDYHLMLMPAMLRKNLPDSSIGFFMHIPFPSYEVFRLLPNRKEILEGLFGADLIGFHIYDYVRHFLESTSRILGYVNTHGAVTMPERIITADAFPIGIDYEKFKAATTSPAVISEINTIKNHYQNRRIILSIDRLDYSKGILIRLKAYEQFLQENPQYHKKVVLVVIAVPSRSEVDDYKELRESIERNVSRINGLYANVDWNPISYQYKNMPFEQLVALYTYGEVLLVTPLRDGMNLVAKEFVACKQNKPGVLILSEMTGAVDELTESLIINPNDITSIVQALKTALFMPKKEQKLRLCKMQQRISQYTAQRWSSDFIQQLSQTRWLQAARNAKDFPNKARREMLIASHEASKRLILLDYDGTLHAIVTSPKPSRSAPLLNLKILLKKLSSNPKNKVCIISGRPKEVLDAWFGDMDIALAAEHGAWVKDKGEWSQAQYTFKKYRQLLLPILERYKERTPGAEIEEKKSSIVWHYRNVTPELAYARNTSLKHELKQILARSELSIYNGHKIIEMKPHAINKGSVALEFLATFPADFILAAGDDYTDEPVFEVLPETAYTIKVGLGETNADFRVPNSKYVLNILRKIAE